MRKTLTTATVIAGAMGVLMSFNASAVSILWEDFEGGIPGAWSTTDDNGNGLVWGVTGAGTCSQDGNYTNGSGLAACANSDAFGSFTYDTSLVTSTFSLAGYTDASLSYTSNYQNVAGQDFLDVDISIDGGTSWNTLLSWNEDHGGFYGTPGEDVSLDLAGYLGESSVNLRWRYHENINGFDWYAQIDDVHVQGTPTATPEPSTLAAIGIGLAGLAAFRRRRMR